MRWNFWFYLVFSIQCFVFNIWNVEWILWIKFLSFCYILQIPLLIIYPFQKISIYECQSGWWCSLCILSRCIVEYLLNELIYNYVWMSLPGVPFVIPFRCMCVRCFYNLFFLFFLLFVLSVEISLSFSNHFGMTILFVYFIYISYIILH